MISLILEFIYFYKRSNVSISIKEGEDPIPFRNEFDSSLRISIILVSLFFWEHSELEFNFGKNRFLLLSAVSIPGGVFYFIYWLVFRWKPIIDFSLIELPSIKSVFFEVEDVIKENIMYVFLFIIFVSIIIFLGYHIDIDKLNNILSPIVMFSILLGISIRIILSLKNKIFQFSDMRFYNTISEEKNITWQTVFHILQQFKTEQWQSKYLTKLRKQKILVTGSYPDIKDVNLKGIKSEIELAKLREQVYELIN